jgi:hypothetical protein
MVTLSDAVAHANRQSRRLASPANRLQSACASNKMIRTDRTDCLHVLRAQIMVQATFQA